jgi:hypothetical protein
LLAVVRCAILCVSHDSSLVLSLRLGKHLQDGLPSRVVCLPAGLAPYEFSPLQGRGL